MKKNLSQFAIVLVLFFFISSSSADDLYPFRSIKNPSEQILFLNEKIKKVEEIDSLVELAWLYHFYKNENDKAEELFKKVLEKEPNNIWAHFGLTLIYKIKGDFDQILHHSFQICKEYPEHPLAEIAVHNIKSLFGHVNNLNERTQIIFQDIVETRKWKNIEFNTVAIETLLRIYEYKNDPENLEKFKTKLGFIKNWRIVGPFTEFPNLAFFDSFPPETEPALKREYEIEKEEIETKTFVSQDGLIDPYWVKDGLYYAQTFINSPGNQDVILRISSPKAIEISLNDTLIYRKDSIRSYQPLVESIKTNLGKGWNKLTLKFLTYPGNKSLFVQLFDENGCLPDVIIDSKPKHIGKTHPPRSEKIDSSGMKYFQSLLKANPDDAFAVGMIGFLSKYLGDTEDAKELLYRSLERNAEYAYFNYVLGDILHADSSQPIKIARSEAKKHFGKAIEAAGQYPSALYRLALYEKDEEKYKEAIEKLKKCVEQSPKFYLWHKALYDIYSDRGWDKERKTELDAIFELNKESNIPYYVARDYYSEKKDYGKLNEIIAHLQKTHIHPEYLAQHYNKIGEVDKAIQEYKKLKAFDPYNSRYRNTLVHLYEKSNDLKKAETEVKELIDLYPENDSYLQHLAELSYRQGKASKAKRILKRVLAKNPLNYSVRKSLELLGTRDVLDEYEIDIWPYINDENLRERYSGVSSVIVVDQAVEEIYANGAGREKIHQLVLLNNKSAIDDWGEVDIPDGSEVLELRTIKKDGTIVEPEVVGGTKQSVSLTDLSEGDFIEMKYIVPNRPSRVMEKSYLSKKFYFQNLKYPMTISQYIVVTPAEIELEYETVNFDDKPEIWKKGGKIYYKWERHDIEEVTPEPFAVDSDEYLPFVWVGFNRDPNFTPLWYENNNIQMVKLTREIKQATEKIIETLKNSDEKVKAIYTYVNDKIYGSLSGGWLGESASQTLGDKSGNRLALLKTMLDYANIKSEIVMVQNITTVPSKVFPNHYPYGLLAIPDKSGNYFLYLDTSNKYYPYGFIHPRFQGSSAIVLRDFSMKDLKLDIDSRDYAEETLETPKLPSFTNSMDARVDLSVDEEGNVTGIFERKYRGAFAASVRGGFIKAEEFQIKNGLQQDANKHFRGAELKEYDIEKLEDFNEPFVVRYSFSAPRFGKVSGREMVFDQRFFPLEMGTTYIRLPERKTPMALYGYPNTHYHIVLHLPDGVEIKDIPNDLKLLDDFGIYAINFSVQDSVVVIDRNYSLPIQKVSAQKYSDLVEFCKKIDELEKKEIKILLPEKEEEQEKKEEETSPAVEEEFSLRR